MAALLVLMDREWRDLFASRLGRAHRSIVNELLAGDVARLKEFSARFSDVVYPGDTLTTEGWKSGDGYIIQVRTDRSIILNNARAIIE